MLIRLIFVYACQRPTHVTGQHTFAPGWRERLVTGHPTNGSHFTFSLLRSCPYFEYMKNYRNGYGYLFVKLYGYG